MLKCSTWEEVNVKLINKNWAFSSSKVSVDPRESVITWSYKENLYTEKANGWFYLFTYDNKPAKARYQVGDVQVYNSILNGVIGSGYKLASSQVLDNGLLSRYENSTWIVTFIKSKGEEDYITKTYNVIEVVAKGSVYDPNNGAFEIALTDSLTFKGNLKDGKIEGEAIYVDETGNVVQRVYFKNDKKDGDCKYYDDQGRVITEGKYKNGLKQGKWYEYEYDVYGLKSATYFTNYKDGVENGEFQQKLRAGGSQHGFYVNGKVHGALEEYDKAGNITLKTTLNQDSLDGITYYYIWNSSGVCVDTLFATYKMGMLDGPCEFWYGDEYIEGGFSNDLLNGYCKVYKNEDVLLGENMVPSTLLLINAEGNYTMGKRTGIWKEYSFGKLHHQGEYLNGKKNGPWQYFATTYKEGNMIQDIVTYKNGIRNGMCRSNFDLDLVRCADSTPGCYQWVKTPNVLEGNYVNDLADGKWVKKDSLGRVLWVGNYNLDKKSGQWTYNYYDTSETIISKIGFSNDLEYGPYTIESSTRGVLQKGSYINGKLSGTVNKYFPGNPDLMECTMNYVAGEISGAYTWSDRDGHEITGTYYRNRIASCVVSDSTGKMLYSLEHIVLLDGTKYSSLYTIETDSGTVSQQITYDIGTSYDSIMPFQFLWKFENERDQLRLTYTGTYTFKNNGVVIASGQLIKGVKTGQWIYNYNPEVTWKVTYTDGVVVDEYFVNSAGAYSGKYKADFPGNNESVMFKVEGGVRDGKSEYMRNGKEYRHEKYKKGVLQK